MTKIQWTDEVWNPVIGCSKVHTGCTNCYAERMAGRQLPAFENRHNLTVTSGRWNGHVVEQKDRFFLPFRWRKPRRVFVTSMSDMGHPSVDDVTRATIYGVMILNPTHTFQNLTKRPQEIERFKRDYSPAVCIAVANSFLITPIPKYCPATWQTVANIHEYVSVSDQATADEFIPQLLRVPAAMRGVSLEPMVGAADIAPYLRPRQTPNPDGYGGDIPSGWVTDFRTLNHVIVGGESGRNARPCEVEWIRVVVRQCHAASVPVFVKQLGSNPGGIPLRDGYRRVNRGGYPLDDPKGGDPSEWPVDLRVRMNMGDTWT